jgi:hypothetical protein
MTANHLGLNQGDAITLVLPSYFVMPIDEADIGISVHYTPWFLPISLKRQFRFLAKPMSDGRVHWIASAFED